MGCEEAEDTSGETGREYVCECNYLSDCFIPLGSFFFEEIEVRRLTCVEIDANNLCRSGKAYIYLYCMLCIFLKLCPPKVLGGLRSSGLQQNLKKGKLQA